MLSSTLLPTYPGPIPTYTLSDSPSSPGSQQAAGTTSKERSIDIEGWTVRSGTGSIMTSAQIDAAAETHPIPLPEMTFPSSHLTLIHRSGFTATFGALAALREVKEGKGWDAKGGVRVRHAEEWGKTRSTGPSALLPSGSTLPTNPVKPFDWTYSTLHPGVYTFPPSTSSSSAADADDGKSPKKTAWRPADPENPTEAIPLELLSRPDPILFYDEIALFESELDDNGSSCLSVRVRVMPHSIFLLHRHFLRVDGVLFRTFDVRLFIPFPSRSSPHPKVIREVLGCEGSFSSVLSYAQPGRTPDLGLLDNQGWVHQTLSGRKVEEVAYDEGEGWDGKMRRVEVWEIPGV